MSLRPTQATIFELVQRGMQRGMSRLILLQEQAATGKRILEPSDDPLGTTIALAARRQKGGVQAYMAAIQKGRPALMSGAARLQDASGLVAQARETLMQAMNGTLSDADRETLATKLELVHESLLELANAREGERYLFSGTRTDTRPFVEALVDGHRTVRYRGDDLELAIPVGRGVALETNVPGSVAFGGGAFTAVGLQGITGARPGASASSGTGYHDLHLRHDATVGALGGGLALANGGADDTILGAHDVTVDAAAGTARLGTGPAVAIPSPLPAALELRDADGSVVVLDFTGWTGVDVSATLTGQGSVALNGGPYQAVTLAETDLQLVDSARGAVLHVDLTGVTRAATELVTYEGAANLFDTLLGAAEDLRNDAGLDPAELAVRLGQRLTELDQGHLALTSALGTLGARNERMDVTEGRLGDLGVHLDGLIAGVEDADLVEVVADLARTEQTLTAAQATGARIMQQTLLNFIR